MFPKFLILKCSHFICSPDVLEASVYVIIAPVDKGSQLNVAKAD